jgi:hypothetical protein
MLSLIYRSFKAIIRLDSMPCPKTWRTVPRQTPCARSADLDLSELQSIVPPKGFGRD